MCALKHRYSCIYVYVYIYTYIYIYIYIYHTQKHICACMCIHTRIHTTEWRALNMKRPTRIQTCLHFCMYVYKHTHTYHRMARLENENAGVEENKDASAEVG